MSDGDYQREVQYLPFVFEGELIEPEQYLAWHQLKDEYEVEQYLKEYGRNNMDIPREYL